MLRNLGLILIVFWQALCVYGQEGYKVLNSPFDESNVVLAPDGKTLYFTIGNHNDNVGGRKDKGDVWYSTVSKEGIWSEPTHLNSDINSQGKDRVLGFSPNGLVMYLHGHYGEGGSAARTQGIARSVWNGNEWSGPRNISIPYFKNLSAHQSGYITPDEEVLVLSIESYNTQGNEDIYVCFKRGDGWTEPMNLGADINTKNQEFTPFLSDDHNVLFFSTNGRGGVGSSDIFYAKRLDDTWKRWSEPENLGEKINTDGKDWNLVLISYLKKLLYVATRSSDGYGEINIIEPFGKIDTLFSPVSEPAPELIVQEIVSAPPLMIRGEVNNEEGKPLSTASVTFLDGDESSEVLTDINGNYQFIPKQTTSYIIRVAAPQFIPQERGITTGEAAAPMTEDFTLTAASVGVTVNLKNVLFKQASTQMLPGSSRELDLVVQLLKENPSMEIELAGHTDNRGAASKNLKLSKQRVKEVKQYIISRGIASGRVTGKGYGGKIPIASNEDEETRMLNRRVEFTITKE
ncbi:MAG: OmpA family protein [Cyclobacteriaceae bacterium]|nr:OmpA family protein [Cyclobacteriaceae bacterium]